MFNDAIFFTMNALISKKSEKINQASYLFDLLVRPGKLALCSQALQQKCMRLLYAALFGWTATVVR
ncbi:MAG TPA: hypothetical protein DHV17_03080 [Chitinophagaceae bacterium]|nr:hypothetical protein [Chitinophagaceae bacterium]